MDPAQRSSRLIWACDRCRRQKLKCDVEKPCILCVRAGATCEPQLSTPESPLKRKRSLHLDAGPRVKSSRLPAISNIRSSSNGDTSYQAGRSHFPDTHPDAPVATTTSPEESQQYGANDSTMRFAKIVLGEDDENDSPATGTIPGDAQCCNTAPLFFPWISTPLPSQSVLQAAVDAYFDRVNWYIMLFHQPSFNVRAQHILRRSAWRREELCDVILVATVAAIGLRCVEYDKSWEGHRLLETYSVTAGSLSADLMSQIGSHFYGLMLENRIEVYQICMALTTYHVYYGSPNFAWNVSGISMRTAYALALHCDKAHDGDAVAREVSNRCWNHMIVADQFSSMIFGRPAALDPAFARLKKLVDLDDTILPEGTANLPIVQEHDRNVTFLTFHTLKFELYDIIRQTLQSFRVMQLRNPISIQDLNSLIKVVHTTEIMLEHWHENLPAVFKLHQWEEGDPWSFLELDRCPPEDVNIRRKIGLQGLILRLLYDAALVWAHRPLLKLRISLSSKEDNVNISLDDMPDSLGVSVQAALRMSRIPINDFDGQLAQSFMLMHLFTAGVILCIAPSCQPYSQIAAEAKAGVLRIIATCRGITDESKIAKHTDQMLTRLYKKTMQREMDNALRTPNTGISKPQINQTLTEKPVPVGSKYQLSPPGSNTAGKTTAPTTQVKPMTPTAASHGGNPMALETHGDNGLPDESVVSYLQFESMRHNATMDSHVNENLDEAYGAFEQMFNLDFADFPFKAY